MVPKLPTDATALSANHRRIIESTKEVCYKRRPNFFSFFKDVAQFVISRAASKKEKSEYVQKLRPMTCSKVGRILGRMIVSRCDMTMKQPPDVATFSESLLEDFSMKNEKSIGNSTKFCEEFLSIPVRGNALSLVTFQGYIKDFLLLLETVFPKWVVKGQKQEPAASKKLKSRLQNVWRKYGANLEKGRKGGQNQKKLITAEDLLLKIFDKQGLPMTARDREALGVLMLTACTGLQSGSLLYGRSRSSYDAKVDADEEEKRRKGMITSSSFCIYWIGDEMCVELTVVYTKNSGWAWKDPLVINHRIKPSRNFLFFASILLLIGSKATRMDQLRDFMDRRVDKLAILPNISLFHNYCENLKDKMKIPSSLGAIYNHGLTMLELDCDDYSSSSMKEGFAIDVLLKSIEELDDDHYVMSSDVHKYLRTADQWSGNKSKKYVYDLTTTVIQDLMNRSAGSIKDDFEKSRPKSIYGVDHLERVKLKWRRFLDKDLVSFGVRIRKPLKDEPMDQS